MTRRLRTTQTQREQLRELSGQQCALCLHPAVDIAEAAHIFSAAPKGPRPCKDDADIERQPLSNLMWLCPNCHRHIDRRENEAFWNDRFLQDLKLLHEAYVGRRKSSVGFQHSGAVGTLAAATTAAEAGRYEDALYRYATAAAVSLTLGSFMEAVAALISICPLVFFRTSELGKNVAIACTRRAVELCHTNFVPRQHVGAFQVAIQNNMLRAQLHQPHGESPEGLDFHGIGANVGLLHQQNLPLQLPVPAIVYGAATILGNSTEVSVLFPMKRVIPDLRYVGLYYFYRSYPGDLDLAYKNLVKRGLQRLSGLDDAPALAAAVLLRLKGKSSRGEASAAISQLEKREPEGGERRLQEFRANISALEAWAQEKGRNDIVLEAIGRRLLAGGDRDESPSDSLDLERANVRITPMYYHARKGFSKYDEFCKAASKGIAG